MQERADQAGELARHLEREPVDHSRQTTGGLWEGERDRRKLKIPHNLSGRAAVAGAKARYMRIGSDLPEDPLLLDLFDADGAAHEIDSAELEVKLEGYGFRWLRIQSANEHISP